MRTSAKFILGLTLASVITASVCAEVTHTPVTESQFGSVEFKTLITIPDVSPSDTPGQIVTKANAALKGIRVSGPSGPEYTAYFDTKNLDLRKSGYIVRVKKQPDSPDKVKITLKGRWDDVTKAGTLQGASIHPSKYEIDVSGGRKIYAISYKVKVDREYFPDGNVDGESILNGIEARYPGLGTFLRSRLNGNELSAPGFASAYEASASVEPGVLKSAPDGLKMGMDIFKIGSRAVVLEFSFSRGADGMKQGMETYRELGELLRKQGLMSDKQATKTSSYLDLFQKK